MPEPDKTAPKQDTRSRPGQSDNPAGGVAIADVPAPGPKTRQAIAAASDRDAGRLPPPAIRMRKKRKRLLIEPPHADHAGWHAQLRDAVGSRSDDFCTQQLALLIDTLSNKDGKPPPDQEINSAIAIVAGARPANELEAALAVQMAATHRLVMGLLSSAGRSSGERLEVNGNMANKLLRAFAMQTEALAKLKRGGEQTVRVEHVHVHEGAQAIIGNVQHEGGGTLEKPGQAHALALPSPDQERRPMPILAGDGKEAVPHAWRGARQRSAKR